MTTQRLYFSWTCLILQYSQAVLRNAHILCSILALILTNTYWGNAKLYNEGEYILSQEGTLLPWQCMLHCPLSASFRGAFPSPGMQMMLQLTEGCDHIIHGGTSLKQQAHDMDTTLTLPKRGLLTSQSIIKPQSKNFRTQALTSLTTGGNI